MVNRNQNPEQHYLLVIKRFAWLIILLPVLAGALAFLFFNNQPQLYAAESQLLIGPSTEAPDPDLNALRASEHLMQTYRKMAGTDTFLQSVIDEVKPKNLTTAQLLSMVDVQTDSTSLVLSISVQSTDKQLAVDLANSMARQLVKISPSSPDSSAYVLRENNQAQAIKLENSMKQSEARVTDLEASINKLDEESRQSLDANNNSLAAAQTRVNSLENDLLGATDISKQFELSMNIVQELTGTTEKRIAQLEQDLAKTDPNLQPIVINQLSAERNHLAGLKQVAAQLQRTYDGQPLDQYIFSLKDNIAKLQATPERPFDTNWNRLIYDQINQYRSRLTDAEIAADTQLKSVLDQLSAERERLSNAQTSPVQKRQYLADQLAAERDRLDNMQKSYTALNDAIYRAWTNQAKVTQFASDALPVASNLRLVLLMAVIGGLAIALAFILAYAYFDKSIYTINDLEESLGAPVLGVLDRTGASATADPLVVQSSPRSHAAEAYRQIIARFTVPTRATTVNAEGETSAGMEFQIQRRVILAGGITHDARTEEVAANLALALAETGHRVLLVDANLHQPGVADMFQVTNENGFTQQLAKPRSSLKAELISDFLAVMPSGQLPENAFGLATSEALPGFIERLRSQARFVLLAGAPLLNYADAQIFANYSDLLLLVIPQGKITREQVDRFLKARDTYKWQVLGIVLVREPGDTVAGPFTGALNQLRQRLTGGAKSQAQQPLSQEGH